MYKNKENNFTGLTEEEVRRSREEHGSNKLPDPELKKWWEFALDALKEPITVILIVITIVTLILSILGVEHISGPILTLIVIGLVTGIAVKTNTAIQKSTENLRRKTAIRYCEVIRDGEVKTINADDLVVGDITMVTLGQEIHADGYLIDGKISVSNAVINGEAEECKKTVIQDYVYEKDESTDAYKNQNHLFAGTVVVAGEGLEKVTVVGKDTVNGETLINMQTLEAPKTALDIALGKLANFINKWGTIAAIIAFVTMTVSGIMQAGLAQYFSGNVLEIINKIAANVSNAATIIVAAVPEGLPLIVKLVTKQNVNIMEKFNILAKNPNKIPELAYVNLICTDKTGTLTTGVMSPEVIVDGEGNEVRDNSDLAKTLHESIVLNNSSFYNEEHKIIGNNFIDRAILSLVVPKEYEMINEKYSIERKQAFSSELKYSVAYCSNGYSYYKGAPEIIIDNCTKYMTADGSVKDWDSSATLAKLSELTQNANRCIAIAVKSGDYEDDTLAQGMTFLGIIGVSDPIRPEAIEAVKVAHKAGIQVIELTGDCMETALAVAKQCGIFREGKDVALTDNEIREMSDDEVKKVLSKLMVVSRCSPNTKLRLVTLAQEMGRSVAMTGDGVNDSPALKKSDVGFGMNSGSDVAKAASDIILTDNNFASVVKSVELGRTFMHNIMMFLEFQLPINISLLVLSIFFPIMMAIPVLTSVQILLINIIMDTLNSLSFGGEPPKEEYMREAPIRKGAGLFIRGSKQRIALSTVSFLVFYAILIFSPIKNLFSTELEANTARFALMCFASVVNGLNIRTEHYNLFDGIGKNNLFYLIGLFIVLDTFLLCQFTGGLFSTAALTPVAWMSVAALALCIIPIDFVRKAIRNKRLARA